MAELSGQSIGEALLSVIEEYSGRGPESGDISESALFVKSLVLGLPPW